MEDGKCFFDISKSETSNIPMLVQVSFYILNFTTFENIYLPGLREACTEEVVFKTQNFLNDNLGLSIFLISEWECANVNVCRAAVITESDIGFYFDAFIVRLVILLILTSISSKNLSPIDYSRKIDVLHDYQKFQYDKLCILCI